LKWVRRSKQNGAPSVRASIPSSRPHLIGERGRVESHEMAAVSAELDDAISAAEPDVGSSWWATTEAGEVLSLADTRLQPEVPDAA
jgi:hypothetical protein